MAAFSRRVDGYPDPGGESPDVPLLETRAVGREYELAGETVHAVRDISMEVWPGHFIAIVGRSGSGKTTLLNLLAGLDRPTSGAVLFEGRDLAAFSEADMIDLRRRRIGFVFQSFALLPLLSAYENVELPMRIAGLGARSRERRAGEILEMVGLRPRARHRPYELSGGEQQRVAIARAVSMKPAVMLADEPTGELDSMNAASIFGLFRDMVTEEGMTIVTTTHDRTLLDMADLVYEIHDGDIRSQGESRMPADHERFMPPAPCRVGDPVHLADPLESEERA